MRKSYHLWDDVEKHGIVTNKRYANPPQRYVIIIVYFIIIIIIITISIIIYLFIYFYCNKFTRYNFFYYFFVRILFCSLFVYVVFGVSCAMSVIGLTAFEPAHHR